MRNSLADVVAAGLRVLDAQGLENCSMRRVAAELGVQPSALYHHVPDKQTLLALMADEIVRPVTAAGAGDGAPGSGSGFRSGSGSRPSVGSPVGPVPAPVSDPGAGDPRSFCLALREAMLAVRDGADVVATASAFRLGASRVERMLASLVGADGARTLLLYTFGHAQSTQTHRQAAAFGALIDPGALPDREDAEGLDPDPAFTLTRDLDASFGRGLDIILAGLGRAA